MVPLSSNNQQVIRPTLAAFCLELCPVEVVQSGMPDRYNSIAHHCQCSVYAITSDACLLSQELPALKFIAKMPRYSDQYTLLISKRGSQDQPDQMFHLMPWLSVLKSCIPGIPSSKPAHSRWGPDADLRA